MADETAPSLSFAARYRKLLLGGLAVALFLAAWQAVFMFVPFNPLFISKPDLIAESLVTLLASGDLAHDFAVSAVPSVLPFIVAAARIAVGRALIGVLVGEFFAASEGIGYAIARFGDLFALDKMFACIATIMVIAVALTEGIRWAERTAFPWRVGQ